MTMKTAIQDTLSAGLASIAASRSLEELKQARAAFLGQDGSLPKLLGQLKHLPPDERKAAGTLGYEARTQLTDAAEARRTELEDEAGRADADFDVTLPGRGMHLGGLHPITQMSLDLCEAFETLGFEVYEEPHISSELYAFDVLNFPADHPARESMDTYWLDGREAERGPGRLCLRPHLTGGSVRYMQTHKPPFRVVYPGRVYRNEATDASHERVFHQFEALIVDRRVPFPSGRLLIQTILTTIFGREVTTRMRAGFFPFVEPGFEIDMQCLVCGGSGCKVCKYVGWLEVMPGGPPHPRVLQAGGIDPAEWEGFYINIGLDRMVMMRYGVDDVRLFHSTDLRFLSQFK